MKVIRAEAGAGRKIGERDGLRRLFNPAAGISNSLGISLVERWIVGLAAFTGPESGRFGVTRICIEFYIPAMREARSAQRPAIDARRGNGVEELAVAIAITRDDRFPARVFG